MDKETRATQSVNLKSYFSQEMRGIVEHVLGIGEDTTKSGADEQRSQKQGEKLAEGRVVTAVKKSSKNLRNEEAFVSRETVSGHARTHRRENETGNPGNHPGAEKTAQEKSGISKTGQRRAERAERPGSAEAAPKQ